MATTPKKRNVDGHRSYNYDGVGQQKSLKTTSIGVLQVHESVLKNLDAGSVVYLPSKILASQREEKTKAITGLGTVLTKDGAQRKILATVDIERSGEKAKHYHLFTGTTAIDLGPYRKQNDEPSWKHREVSDIAFKGIAVYRDQSEDRTLGLTEEEARRRTQDLKKTGSDYATPSQPNHEQREEFGRQQRLKEKFGKKMRARLKEEQKKRPEIQRLLDENEQTALLVQKQQGQQVSTGMMNFSKSPPKNPRKARAQTKPTASVTKKPRTSNSSLRGKRRSSKDSQKFWMPDISNLVPDAARGDDSNVVQLHGFPVHARVEHINSFFSGLLPKKIFVLLSNDVLIPFIDPLNYAQHTGGGGESDSDFGRDNRPLHLQLPADINPLLRVCAEFDSASMAQIATERTGETISVPNARQSPRTSGGDGSGGRNHKTTYSIAVTQVNKSTAMSLLKMSVPLVSGLTLSSTLTHVEKKLLKIVRVILWASTVLGQSGSSSSHLFHQNRMMGRKKRSEQLSFLDDDISAEVEENHLDFSVSALWLTPLVREVDDVDAQEPQYDAQPHRTANPFLENYQRITRVYNSLATLHQRLLYEDLAAAQVGEDDTRTRETSSICQRLTDVSIAVLLQEMKKLKGSLLQAKWNLVGSHEGDVGLPAGT